MTRMFGVSVGGVLKGPFKYLKDSFPYIFAYLKEHGHAYSVL